MIEVGNDTFGHFKLHGRLNNVYHELPFTANKFLFESFLLFCEFLKFHEKNYFPF